MRILALTSTIDRSEAAILAGLRERGADVRIIGAPSPELIVTFRDLGITICEHTFASRFDLGGMRLIRRAYSEYRPDVVYALTARSLSAAVLALYRKPVAIAAYRGTVGHISWLDPSCWITYLSRRVAKIVCVSKAVELYLASKGIPQRRLVTIYKGHDVEWYRFPTPLRAQFSIPSDAFVVGCTAAMRGVKGIDDLLTATGSLLGEIPSLHLLLIGAIKEPAIQRAIDAFPDRRRLHLLGHRTDAPRLARLADVVVMASKSREGFPRAVIEAMAQGLPPIVTAVGGMPELVGHGEAGIMVPPMNPAALASAIKELAHDQKKRSRLGSAALDRIRSVFNIKTTIDLIFHTFEELTSDSCRELPAGTNPSRRDYPRQTPSARGYHGEPHQ